MSDDFMPGECGSEPPVRELELRICEMAGHIAAGTCEYLMLLAEFDAQKGWQGYPVGSCAEWLSWACQLASNTARDQVRVARALIRLPLVKAEFATGCFSYTKVRALCRIATPDTEKDLVEMARSMTGNQIERFAKAHTKASRGGCARPRKTRRLSWRHCADGAVTVSVKLPPEEGMILLQALRAFRNDLEHPHDDGHEYGERSRQPDDQPPVQAEKIPAEELAKALVGVCGQYLESRIASADNPDVYQVIIHAGAAAMTQPSDKEAQGEDCEGNPEEPAPVSAETARGWPEWHPAWLDRCHVENSLAIPPATLRLIGCNTTISTMLHDADGKVLAVGRRTRKPPPALRRAVRERDRHRCTFPGCDSRKVDLHHVIYWADGGRTDMDNLLCLCEYHHVLVHEDFFKINGTGDGFEFYRPDGTPMPACPQIPNGDGDITTSHAAVIEPTTIVPPDSPDRLNLDLAIWICFANAKARAEARQNRRPSPGATGPGGRR